MHCIGMEVGSKYCPNDTNIICLFSIRKVAKKFHAARGNFFECSRITLFGWLLLPNLLSSILMNLHKDCAWGSSGKLSSSALATVSEKSSVAKWTVCRSPETDSVRGNSIIALEEV